MTFPIHLLLIAYAIFAAIAGVVASLLFGLALRYGPFIKGANRKSQRIRRLRETIVFVVVAMGIVLGPIVTFPVLLVAGIVIGIRFATDYCRRRHFCRVPRDLENNNTIEPTGTGRIELTLNA